MKKIKSNGCMVFVVVLAALLLAPYSSYAAPSDLEVRPPESRDSTDGITITERLVLEKRSDGAIANAFLLSTVKIDETQLQLTLLNHRDGSSLDKTAQERSSAFGDRAFAVISAGFVNSYDPFASSGLVKVKGEIENRSKDVLEDPILSGMLCLQGKDIRIFASPSPDNVLEAVRNYDDCLQSGPLLVSDAKQYLRLSDDSPELLRRFSEQRYQRSFLMRSKTGDLFFGFTTPTSLTALSQILLEQANRGGLEARSVLSLHGSKNAGLAVFKSGKAVYKAGFLDSPQATTLVASPP